jgi:hypothetical protein
MAASAVCNFKKYVVFFLTFVPSGANALWAKCLRFLDIVNKCMFNMAEVTDSEEIHLAATQVS